MENTLNKMNGFKAEFFELEAAVSRLDQIDFTRAASHIEALETLSFTQARANEPFWKGGADDNFAARASGDLHIETGGSYTFYLISDDGSSFSIDGNLVINNDGLHAAQEQTVTLDLSAGTIPFEILYFEKGGQQVLSLEWSGPDTAGVREYLGQEAVSHDMPVVEEETGQASHEQEVIAVSGFKAEFFELEAAVSRLDQIDFTRAASHIEALETLSFTQARANEPFWKGGADDNFAARASGDLHIETGGSYTFYLISDDGSSFSIDGNLVINNDGLHAAQEQTVTLDLSAGTIPFEILYFEKGGQQVLSLEWSGPDTAGVREYLGQEAVSHDMPVVEEETGQASHEQEVIAVSGFKAEFFELEAAVSRLDQIDFTRAASHIEALETLSFTQARANEPFWKGGADDNFAARASGDLHIETGGSYTFYLISDDGSSFSIDGNLVINNDGLHAAQEQTVTLDLSAGTIPFEILYFEKGGQQVLSLEWSGPDTAGVREYLGQEAVSHDMPVVEEETGQASHEQEVIAVSGFKAEFFELEAAVSRLDQIDFTRAASHIEALETLSFTQARANEPFWKGGADDNFAARASGDLHIETGGSYTFYLISDDGSSFSIDGNLVINNDGLHAAQEQTVTLDLSAGTIPFEILYFEKGGQQVLSLEWSGPDTAGVREYLGQEAVSHDMPVVEEETGQASHEMDPVEEETDHTGPEMDPVEEETGQASHEMDPVEEETDHTGHEMDPVEDGTDHAGHEMDHGADPVALPQSEAEIDAFVAAVRASPEVHSHDMGSSMAGEHMAAMDLVPRAEATHIAIGNGDWDNPANWHNGEVPGDDARVLIPEGLYMAYDHVSDARLFTLRVDGHLDFATDVDSQMIVDTIVITPSGALTIGTATDPVDPNVNVDIIFANNGAIDTDWDPMLLSRGMIAHGTVEIHGAEKDSHEKVIDDPQVGDTWLSFGETPNGWAVGDTIVVAGTHYKGYLGYDPAAGYVPPEDEIRVITQIEDGMVFFENPLKFDHDSPREDLKTSVANYTRNVSFETENADLAEVYERGHVMFMHNDDVDVRYAEFHELGRTDKSEVALSADEFINVDFDSNVKGRYSFHFHRAGLDDQENPAISVGNAVYGSPGWGFVHHESNAILDNNATYDTFGAGYVAENGTETGAWTDNIAIFSQGTSWKDPKLGNGDLNDFDLGRTGDGFWFQGRMVASVDNVAASVNNGFVYFHRGTPGDDEQTYINTDVTDIPFYNDRLSIDDHPILGFSGNEAFASKMGLYILRANPDQGHDVHTVLEDFTGWNIRIGAEMSYTAHYTLKDFDLVAAEDAGSKSFGISLGNNASDIAIVDSTIQGFANGMMVNHTFTINGDSAEDSDYTIVNPTFIDVSTEIEGFDPTFDTLLSSEDLPYLTPDIELDGPLTYKEGWPDPDARQIKISGTKTDGLGTTDITGGADDYTVPFKTAVSFLEEEGYYTTTDGQNYAMLDIYFSDRLTGDIYMEKHPVFLNENVPVEKGYANAPFNGVQNLGVEGDPTIDSAILWASLTKGQVVLTEEALAIEADVLLEIQEQEIFFEDVFAL